MLTGRVTPEKEAVVEIQVLGPAGQASLVEAAIDTGYDGFITLPSSLIRDLDLSFAGAARATLGDGNEVGMDIFLASVARNKEEAQERPKAPESLGPSGAPDAGTTQKLSQAVILTYLKRMKKEDPGPEPRRPKKPPIR